MHIVNLVSMSNEMVTIVFEDSNGNEIIIKLKTEEVEKLIESIGDIKN